LSYAVAFMIGLAGSGHCLGMCGGLVSGFFMKVRGGGTAAYFAYHMARLTIYALVGLIAAALGAILAASVVAHPLCCCSIARLRYSPRNLRIIATSAAMSV
jgi:sulfite exporter TauE/SafE